MSKQARNLKRSARHKKYRHQLYLLKEQYKNLGELRLDQLKKVAWMLTEPVAKGWKRFTFMPLTLRIKQLPDMLVGVVEY